MKLLTCITFHQVRQHFNRLQTYDQLTNNLLHKSGCIYANMYMQHKTNIFTETQMQIHGKDDGKFTYQYKHLQLSTSTPKFINWTDIFTKVYVKIESKYLQASIDSVHYIIHTCNAIHKHRSKFSLCVVKKEYFVLLVREPSSTEDDSDLLSAIVTHSRCRASLAVKVFYSLSSGNAMQLFRSYWLWAPWKSFSEIPSCLHSLPCMVAACTKGLTL